MTAVEDLEVVTVSRLWWSCTLCGLRVATDGVDHHAGADRTALAHTGAEHLEVDHDLDIESHADVLALFDPAGKTSRDLRAPVT